MYTGRPVANAASAVASRTRPPITWRPSDGRRGGHQAQGAARLGELVGRRWAAVQVGEAGQRPVADLPGGDRLGDVVRQARRDAAPDGVAVPRRRARPAGSPSPARCAWAEGYREPSPAWRAGYRRVCQGGGGRARRAVEAAMDLTYTRAEEEFRARAAVVAAGEHPGRSGRVPASGRRRARTRASRCAADWEREKAFAGFAGIQWPTEYGGRGGTPGMKAIYDEEMVRARAPRTVNPLGPGLPRAHRDGDRHRRAEEGDHRAAAAQRGHLVPGLLRARRRLRPGGAVHPRRARRRRLRRQRPEGLDHQRRPRRQDLRAGPHRARVGASTGASRCCSSTCTSPASRPARSSR